MTEPLRVLQLLPDLAVGGGQMVLLRQLPRMDPRRLAHLIAYRTGPTDLADAFAAVGLGSPHRARSVADVVQLARREGVRLICTHTRRETVMAYLAARMAGCGVVVTLHSEYAARRYRPQTGAPPDKSWRLAGEELLSRNVLRHVVAVSTIVRDEWLQHRSRLEAAAPVTVVPAGVPVHASDAQVRKMMRERFGVAHDVVTVVTVGRLTAGKGHELVIDAVAELRRRGVPALLLVVGDGPLRDALQRHAEHAGAAEGVRLLGTRHDVAAILSAADVFAFASASEGFGLAVVEAMAAGLPVVITPLPALADVVIDGETGRVVSSRSVVALAEALADVIADRAGAAQLAAAGRELVASRFDVQRSADALQAVYLASA